MSRRRVSPRLLGVKKVDKRRVHLDLISSVDNATKISHWLLINVNILGAVVRNGWCKSTLLLLLLLLLSFIIVLLSFISVNVNIPVIDCFIVALILLCVSSTVKAEKDKNRESKVSKSARNSQG